jgi:phosphatidylinositol alpha-1,6-mannosyltransferase
MSHDKRVRHLFVTQDYPPDAGGMARRHVELCRRFAPDTVVVSTVAAADGGRFDRGEPYAIERQPFPFAQAKRFVRQLSWANTLVRHARSGLDVLHLGNIRPCGYAVALATRRANVPYLVYVNGGDLLRERRKGATDRLKRITARDILGRAVGIVANSAWTAALAREVLALVGVTHPVPVAAIDLGTDPEQFRPSRDAGTLRARLGIGDAPVLLSVARLVPHKGQDVAIRALARLAGRSTAGRTGAGGEGTRPAPHLVLVGDGADAGRLRVLAGELGVAERVHLTGPLPDEAIAEAYATADLFVGLSRVDNTINAEGFGISFVEAAASGTPSVAGDSGGVRSAVRDGETGLVVDASDVDAVAGALRNLLGDEARRLRMGAAAREAVVRHYNWDRVARETLDFTRRCVEPLRLPGAARGARAAHPA